MDNYREKIVRIVERELKRTEEYQQRRDEYGNEEYILGCIMVKGDAFPKEVIAHAFVEDMGLELQFQVWRDEPRIRQKQAMWYDLTLFDVEGDFFGKLEQGYLILSVSDLFHCTAWNATEYLADEQNRDKENSCWKGMQRYLNYCKKHGITRNYLVKKEEYDGIDATRTLTTECTAVLMPFKSQEIQDAGGIYYGVNAVSHNLIVCNRGNLLNGNGFITGVSGSGKSMAAKQEVSALALSTDHDIIIVDPEREYGELVRALGGEVITISAADPNGCHINALDLSEGYGDGREPLVMKSEFIMSLYEQLMGADKIEPQEKSIIDRSVGNIYREYIKNFQGQPPTLKDLYDDLMKQVNPEAHRIALALELFTVGSLNVFSHQTNINTKSRILCFDIQDLGENLKSVGLLVMLDAIYNRVIQNRREGKYTHVYIDEIYLFFANGSGSGRSITNYSSEFLYKCWKRFRKYGATLTGITQNVEECLLSNTARMMFANSEFLLMLNQATTDREQLARLLGASDTQMSYVDNAPAGHGLIKVGGAIVPFANELPKNTELYRLMTTKPGED